MKLQHEFMIDGNVVTKFGKVGNIDLFVDDTHDQAHNLYFVTADKTVLKVLKVGADCAQNVGYIDLFRLEDI